MRAYRVAYDGRPFHGFQRQPDVPTVEDAIFDGFRELGVLETGASKPTGYAAAGRTDAGVSARAQTVAFEAPDWLSPRALNSELPASVRAWASADVESSFHATHHASSREYVYYLYAPAEGGLDVQGVRDALARLSGEHDFHNLTPDNDGTVRDLDLSVEREGDFLVIRLSAGGFARQLVRRVVGLVAEIGRGESSLQKIDRVFSADELEGPDGVEPAQPYPLVLWDVSYPDVEFSVDQNAVASAREVFGSRHAEFQIRSRVAGSIRDSLD